MMDTSSHRIVKMSKHSHFNGDDAMEMGSTHMGKFVFVAVLFILLHYLMVQFTVWNMEKFI